MNFYWVFWSICTVFLGYGIVSILTKIERHLSVITAYRILSEYKEKIDHGDADPLMERTVREADEMLRQSIGLMVIREDEND